MSQSAHPPGLKLQRLCAAVVIAFGVVACAACAPRGKKPDAPQPAHRPFDVDTSGSAQRLEPALISRVRASPTAYFRFVNAAFGNEVCRRFQRELPSMGVVSLHGDPHLFQYAVTDTGRGLSDFDDAASGPPVLDLVRFSTSLVLACSARGWDRDCERVLQSFFSGYTAALGDPKITTREPAIVTRLRSGFRFDPAHYFGWLHSISEPVTSERRAAIEKALGSYIDAMLVDEPTLTREYFQVEALGRSRMGIGSARTQKYVVRLRGKTESADDDVVLELKEVGNIPNISCLSPATILDPMRQIVAQERLVYEPYRLVGYVVIDQRYFWVHAWARSYHELGLGDLASASELSELAYDVGVQLGLGHPKLAVPPQDGPLRAKVARFVDAHIAELTDLSRVLAGEVTAAWSRFREQTAAGAQRSPGP